MLLLGFCYVTVDVLFLHGPLRHFDHVLYGKLLLHDDHNFRWWASKIIGEVGNEYLLLPALGIVTLVASWRTRSVRPMVISFCVGASLGILVPAVKIVTGRTKPLQPGHDSVFAGGTTYPSGHVVNSILLMGLALELLVLAWPALQRWLGVRVRRWLVVLSGAMSGAGTLGLSYHWFTDVLAGWLLGAAMFVVLIGLDVFAPLHAKLGDREQPRPGAASAQSSRVPSDA
ncbi:MAG TPA: phosphatase PAP2 family protein [Segeticoccus sp.]|uniref:phosphatase PAP2 family protein n=1 Tax=Segeticoccus sp. TaxID=2706531 RepID=UPI002D7F1642|nr:phosphatase PAP2 family protein [Segeticoccus sp.]HET8599633.1 phosphatase PAP2 family protein [Segeticoccus sp.]